MGDDGHDNVLFLDRHVVICDEGEVLAGFQMARNHFVYQLSFKYISVLAAMTGSIEELWTDLFPGRKGSVAALIAHGVMCPGDSVLKRFRINRGCAQNQLKLRYWAQHTQ